MTTTATTSTTTTTTTTTATTTTTTTTATPATTTNTVTTTTTDTYKRQPYYSYNYYYNNNYYYNDYRHYQYVARRSEAQAKTARVQRQATTMSRYAASSIFASDQAHGKTRSDFRCNPTLDCKFTMPYKHTPLRACKPYSAT